MSNIKKAVLISMVIFVLFTTVWVIAQPEETATGNTEAVKKAEGGSWVSSVIRFYIEGGWAMHVILLLALISIGIAVERAYKLWVMQRFNVQEFYVKLKTYLRNEKYDEAIRIAKSFRKTAMGSIFLYGLKGFTEAKESGKTGVELSKALQNSFDEACLNEMPKLEKRLHYLDTFAQMATLMGLLGTIFGLVQSFGALGTLPPEQQNAALTRGIAVAMHTTAFGLIVALPTMLVKAWLQGKASNIMNEIDEYSVKTINVINSNI